MTGPGRMTERPERILIVTWNFPPKKGGMENLNYDIYRNLSSCNDIFVIGPYAPNADDDPRIFRAPIAGIFPFLAYALIKGLHMCRSLDFKIVFGGSLIVTPILYLISRFVPCTIAYAHGLDIIYSNRIYRFFVRAAVKQMDGIICNSRHTLSLLRERFEYHGRSRVIPPGICIDAYRQPRSKVLRDCDKDKPFLLSVGRLTDRKGLLEFIENCFVDLAVEFPDLDFIIAGDDPVDAVYHGVGYRKRLEKAITSVGLSERVHLPGWVDERTKKRLLATCECLVFPVHPTPFDVEGFGIVAIEAAASGRPTIAFDTGGVRDAVLDGITGKLIASGDYNGMLDAIRAVLTKSVKYSCDVEDIRNRFDWEFLTPAYLEFFNICCSGSKESG